MRRKHTTLAHCLVEKTKLKAALFQLHSFLKDMSRQLFILRNSTISQSYLNQYSKGYPGVERSVNIPLSSEVQSLCIAITPFITLSICELKHNKSFDNELSKCCILTLFAQLCLRRVRGLTTSYVKVCMSVFLITDSHSKNYQKDRPATRQLIHSSGELIRTFPLHCDFVSPPQMARLRELSETLFIHSLASMFISRITIIIRIS